jgi:hypothetical protein
MRRMRLTPVAESGWESDTCMDGKPPVPGSSASTAVEQEQVLSEVGKEVTVLPPISTSSSLPHLSTTTNKARQKKLYK